MKSIGNIHMNIQASCYIFLCVSLIYFPALTFLLSLGMIFFLGDTKILRWIIYPPLIISFTLISISRDIFSTYKDDFITYYFMYDALVHKLFENYFGIEVGLASLNFLIEALLPHLSPRELLFIYVTIQVLLIVFLIETYIDKVKIKEPATLVGLVFLFMPFLAFTLTIRQNIAVILMVIAFFIGSRIYKYMILILSALFHLSVVPIMIIIYAIWYLSNKSYLTILCVFAVSFLLLGQSIQYIGDLPKLRAFSSENLDFDFFVYFSYYKTTMFLLCLLILFRNDKNKKFIKSIFVIIIITFCLDYHLPYVSFRLTQPFILLLGVGYFIFYNNLEYAINKVLFRTAFFVSFIIFKSYVSIYGDSDFSLFRSIEMYSQEPFYYLHNINENMSTVDRSKL
ncbi:hypothetical protein FXE22_00045 [Vibrio cholerae]|nr:hypothetical protein FXE22_00045 [Vibrio cholerae]